MKVGTAYAIPIGRKNIRMELNNNRVIELTWKHLKNELTEADSIELNSWLADPVNKARFEQRISPDNILEGLTMMQFAKLEAESGWKPKEDNAETSKVVSLGEGLPANKRRRLWMVAAAAVVLTVTSVTLLSKISRKENHQENIHPLVSTDLPPGGNKATLTLEDGSTVPLDDADKGPIAKQGGSVVIKEAGGQLAYRKGEQIGAIGYNIVTTPRGGQYRVLLPDGSQVWLNSGSSIKFPTAFVEKNREVLLTGQGYFEISRNPQQPFIVKVQETEIRVLGTSFDVMAYDDEQTINAALLEGSVSVAVKGQQVLLHPTYQAKIDQTGSMKVEKVNTDEVVAWKNGFLEFDGKDIATVMRAVSRWWDVDVRFAAKVDSHAFSGQLSKSLKASEALRILETSGYHFKVDGRIVTVLP